MNVVFISPRFYPEVGGVEKHVMSVSEELLKKGHTITVVTELTPKIKHNKKRNYQSIGKSDNWGINSKWIDKSTYFVTLPNGIDVWYVHFGKSGPLKKFRIWKKMLGMKRVFQKADVIHCHDIFVWYLPLRLLLINKKVFTTFHGWEQVFPIPKKNILLRKISENLSAGTIGIGDLHKWYFTNPNVILYGAVPDSPRSNNFVRKKKERQIKIALVGRLESSIGIHIFLDALRILDNKKVGYRLEVFGDGKLRDEVSRFGEVNGFVEDVSKRVREVDIVFASSYLSIMESLLLKKPVISAFTNPFSEDVLTNPPFGKYITVSNDPDFIAKKVVELQKNYSRAIRKLDGIQPWLREQTWVNIATIYERLWEAKI